MDLAETVFSTHTGPRAAVRPSSSSWGPERPRTPFVVGTGPRSSLAGRDAVTVEQAAPGRGRRS